MTSGSPAPVMKIIMLPDGVEPPQNLNDKHQGVLIPGTRSPRQFIGARYGGKFKNCKDFVEPSWIFC
jgi:hypothetical protein